MPLVEPASIGAHQTVGGLAGHFSLVSFLIGPVVHRKMTETAEMLFLVINTLLLFGVLHAPLRIVPSPAV